MTKRLDSKMPLSQDLSIWIKQNATTFNSLEGICLSESRTFSSTIAYSFQTQHSLLGFAISPVKQSRLRRLFSLPKEASSYQTSFDLGTEVSLETVETLFSKGQRVVLVLKDTFNSFDSKDVTAERIHILIHSKKEWERINTRIAKQNKYKTEIAIAGNQSQLHKIYGKQLNCLNVPHLFWPEIFTYALTLGLTDGLRQAAALNAGHITMTALQQTFYAGLGSCLWSAALASILQFALRFGILWRHQGFRPTGSQTWALTKDSFKTGLKIAIQMLVTMLIYFAVATATAGIGPLVAAPIIGVACAVGVTTLASIFGTLGGLTWKENLSRSAVVFIAVFTVATSWALLNVSVPGGPIVASLITGSVVAGAFSLFPLAFAGVAKLVQKYRDRKTIGTTAAEPLLSQSPADELQPQNPYLHLSDKLFKITPPSGESMQSISLNFKSITLR